MEAIVYRSNFYRDENPILNLKKRSNGDYKVQLRRKLFWVDMIDTHIGHGGHIKWYSKKGAEMFMKEVRARLNRA